MGYVNLSVKPIGLSEIYIYEIDSSIRSCLSSVAPNRFLLICFSCVLPSLQASLFTFKEKINPKRNGMMKTHNLKFILAAVFAITHLATAQVKSIYILVETKTEKMVNGKLQSTILSAPAVTTRDGNEAEIRVVEEFVTTVPGYEKLTQQTGVGGGTILSITSTLHGNKILLSGKLQLFKKPSLQTVENNQGQIAVQKTLLIQFSLKLDGSTKPVQLKPIILPDGSKLLISITAHEVTPEQKKPL